MHPKFIQPDSIVVVGGSNNRSKPGGKLVANLLEAGFTGPIYVVNPKESEVQGLPCFAQVQDLPPVDLAILAIPAELCMEAVGILTTDKGTRGFIVISAGFAEEGEEGRAREEALVRLVNSVEGTLIGPNCIGISTPRYGAMFTSPLPQRTPKGCDLISSSGATAVFIIESALPKGLSFSSIYSVGNSAQTGVEDILQFLDETYVPGLSSKVKLLYIEHIKDPDKLLRHASSLVQKGCRIAAIKSGTSGAGSRAAQSHTGALASSDLAVEALFRKAGIVRCYGREELTTVASIFMHPKLVGKRLAIITHAGGPAVMLTDALSEGGMEIPVVEGPLAETLLGQLPPGASVKNPIDFLATGTAAHLDLIIEYCDRYFDHVDGMVVIFGSTGLNKVFDVYEVLHRRMKTCRKPIFPILPSLLTAQKEVDSFISRGHINFPDEVSLGKALARVSNTPAAIGEEYYHPGVDVEEIRRILDRTGDGFLSPPENAALLAAAGIPLVAERVVCAEKDLDAAAKAVGFPLALKVIGPVHKTDVGGVTLNIRSRDHLAAEFSRMMRIADATGVLLQPMLSGLELFIGANYEPPFGHIILCGLGGIFVEALGDISSGLCPLSHAEAQSMVRALKSYPVLRGLRGRPGIHEDFFVDTIVRLSTLLRHATEIKELDLNPLIASGHTMAVVDARIRIEK